MDVYAIKHKDDEERMKSQSGGAFVVFSDAILEKGGVVYGCVLDDDLKVVHVRASSYKQRDSMRKSKYCASNLGDTFQMVKSDLEDGVYVLFSGTPCQVAGLNRFLGKNYDRLLTIDIVCHGVPSPLVLEKYIHWRERQYNSKLKSFIFRNKAFGWNRQVETLVFENGVKIDSKIYANVFYGDNALRPSCFHCPFKTINHESDLTIADYWGIEKACPEFKDDKGVSLLLVNSDNGKAYFEQCKASMVYKLSNIENATQPALIGSAEKPETRNQFWIDFSSNTDFLFIAKKYGGYTFVFRTKQMIKKMLRRQWLD